LLADGTLRERSIPIEDVLRADAIAVISSVRPWRDAVLVDPALRS